MERRINVPVIMYHSIGKINKKWIYNHLICPYRLFESQLNWMKNKNFHTISLQQLYNYMIGEINLPKNPVVLTFDDGYLDNWVFAYPLLKKYGYKGTIYSSPEFVDPRNICRKSLEDVWNGDIELDRLKTTGFLSWNEMKTMLEEDVMDVQSHAMTHTLYFKNDKIIDFRHPGDPYIWITWNNNPTKKPYLQIDNDNLIEYGEPVYEYGQSLDTKRYFPDVNLSKYLINYVNEHEINDFFKDSNWKNELMKIAESYRKENNLDEKYETNEEYEKRMKFELKKSKEIIEKKLKKEVNFLCWPVGITNQKALEIASDVGYISSTAGRDIKKDARKELKNKYGDNPSRINRIGPTLYWNKIAGYGNKTKYKNGFLLVLSLYSFQERKFFGMLNKSICLGAKIFSTVMFMGL